MNINPGIGLSQPLASIGKAAELTKAGDKVMVRGGLYKIDQTINITCNGTTEHPITIMAYGNEVPVLN